MEKELVPYTEAVALKELGFDVPCIAVYEPQEIGIMLRWVENQRVVSNKAIGYIIAPLYQQAFRWFREKHNLDSFVKHLYSQTVKVGYYFGIDEYKGKEYQSEHFKTYEEAELECLKKLIEIAKGKKS